MPSVLIFRNICDILAVDVVLSKYEISMVDIKSVEELVSAAVRGNNKEIVKILQKVASRAEKAGKVNVAQRVKNILRGVPGDRQFSGQRSHQGFKPSVQDPSLVQRIESETLLDEVILERDAVSTITELCNEWEHVDVLERNKLTPLNKLIFFGPPGTGKTKLAYAIANKLDLPLIVVQLDEVISSFLGKTGKNIKDIFAIAERERVVIFLDEIDTLAKHRDDDKELGELKRVVSVLLQNIDAFPRHSILIGATNHEHLLDKALWRRFNGRVKFDLPSVETRAKLFKLFLGNHCDNVDLDLLANLTPDVSGSYISQVCEKAMKKSVLSGSPLTDQMLPILLREFSDRARGSKGRKAIYTACRIMKKSGYPTKEIARLSGIPYTTLIDQLR